MMKLVLLHSLALLFAVTNGQEQMRPASPLTVTQFRLMDADTNLPVPGYDPLLDGATIDLSTLPAGISLTVEAITTGAVTSVRFDFAGQTRVESSARWLMCGNAGDDLFRCESNPLRNGFNGVIRATPRGRGNTAGTPLAVKVKIVRSVRMSLNLYDSPSNELISPLVNRADGQLRATFNSLSETRGLPDSHRDKVTNTTTHLHHRPGAPRTGREQRHLLQEQSIVAILLAIASDESRL
jgi:hypothetical protein